jgi:hypothetical protein
MLFFTALHNTLFRSFHLFGWKLLVSGAHCDYCGWTASTLLCATTPAVFPVISMLSLHIQYTFCNWFHVLSCLYLWTSKISFQFAQLSSDVLSNKSSSVIYCCYRNVCMDPPGSVHTYHTLGINALLFPCLFSLMLGSHFWCLRWAEICRRKLCVCVLAGWKVQDSELSGSRLSPSFICS